DQIVAGPGRLGAALAEARDRAVDEPWVLLPERLEAEAQSLHGARPEILQHDVGPGDEPVENGLALRRLQVQREALLAAVHRHEVRGLAARERWPAARVVALAGLLDLEDLGAHVAQRHRAEWPREHAGEVDDADAGERRPDDGRPAGPGGGGGACLRTALTAGPLSPPCGAPGRGSC